jgi:hypothetical protein
MAPASVHGTLRRMPVPRLRFRRVAEARAPAASPSCDASRLNQVSKVTVERTGRVLGAKLYGSPCTPIVHSEGRARAVSGCVAFDGS